MGHTDTHGRHRGQLVAGVLLALLVKVVLAARVELVFLVLLLSMCFRSRRRVGLLFVVLIVICFRYYAHRSQVVVSTCLKVLFEVCRRTH